MSEKRKNSFDDVKIKRAFRNAEIHLKKFEKFNKNIVRYIGSITPIFEPFEEEPTIFNVDLQNEKGKNEGYILVSLTKKYPPILKFSFTGKSDIEYLREKVGLTEFNPVIHSAFYMVAEDKEGKFITDYGVKPSIPEEGKSSDSKLDYITEKKKIKEYQEGKLKKRENSILHKWNKVLKKKNEGDTDESAVEYIDPADVPSYDFQVVTAYYPEYLGRYTQIGPNLGANSTHNFNTGCTACAWLCLIGYHNNVYTLDLLRGTHYIRGHNNSYISRVMVELSEHLGTYRGSNGGGACSPSNIKRGYTFIENVMGYSIVNKDFIEDNGIPPLQVVYDAICRWGVPSVISIPGHSLIAYEVLADRNDDRGDHYLKVYQGWGGLISDDPYISYELIDDGAWTFKRIKTNHEVKLNFQSLTTPITIEIGDPQLNTELIIAIRLLDEHIGLLYSQDGKTFELRYNIDATGNTPPSIAVQGTRKDLYIAWKNSDGSLKLAQVYPKTNGIKMLPAPPGVSEYGNVGPVIQVHNGRLFYIWDNNITYANIQNLERSGAPWPTDYGYHSYNDSYLSSLGIVIPEQTPSFISSINKLYYAYSMDREGYGYGTNEMLIFKVKPNGHIEFYTDSEGNMIYHGERKLLDCLNILYGTTYGYISEISRSTYQLTYETKYFPYGIVTNSINIGLFTSYEIGPCVFSTYLAGNDIYIRYHSIDNNIFRLDYTGYPNF